MKKLTKEEVFINAAKEFFKAVVEYGRSTERVVSVNTDNTVKEFLEDTGFKTYGEERHRYSLNEFYRIYRSWCDDHDKNPENMDVMKKTMKVLGYDVKRTRIDSDRYGNPVTGVKVYR